MRKQYASSVYSQKSATSAKSGRSYLSLTTPIWPSSNNNTTTTTTATSTSNDITLNEAKQGIWQSLKSWMPASSSPSSSSSTKKRSTITMTTKKNDSDSITTTRSSSSISKLKHFFVSSGNKKKDITTIESPRLSINTTEEEEEEEEEEEDNDTTTTTTTTSSSIVVEKKKKPIGILVDRGEDSAEAIAERKKRRQSRRENILKLQKHNRSLQYYSQDNVVNEQQQESSSSSSADTLPTPTTSKRMVAFATTDPTVEDEKDEKDYGYYNPRIMFMERSPVPRFRNVAPPPPPSPPYLNILIQRQQEEEQDMEKLSPPSIHSVIKSPLQDEQEPTIFASKDIIFSQPNTTSVIQQPLYHEEEDLEEEEAIKSRTNKPKLYFYSPFYRGQTLVFSLQNTMPDDHIILFKFLTSNSSTTKGERYFVRPSAGKILNSTKSTEIMLFLNQVPLNVKKDKIMIRWAVIQRNTKIEKWVNQLQDETRRKWIDMLDEEWPDQVTIRMTRIRIRFSSSLSSASASFS